jgi:hypothetical protein
MALNGLEQRVRRRLLDQRDRGTERERKHEQRAQAEREADRGAADVDVIGRREQQVTRTTSAIASTSR